MVVYCMHRFVNILCSCCGLVQRVRTDDGGQPTMCSPCIEHRGANTEMMIRRGQEHEEMLRFRWEAARTAANNYEERMKSAFRSRETAVRYLMRLDEIHSIKREGSCTCGRKRDCPSAEILSSGWVQDMIRKVEQRDSEGRDLYGCWWDDDDDDLPPREPVTAEPV